MNRTDRRIESAKTIQTNRRNYRRARDRALEEERMEDAKNGKTWLDISGRTYLDTALDRATQDPGSLFRSPETDRDPQDEGNVEGEE